MNFKDEYFAKRQQLQDLQREVWEMGKRCPHEEKRVKLVETIAFEYTPRYECVVCGEQLRGEISKEEVKECYRTEWFDWLEERKMSEEELEEYYIQNPRGFNLPRPKLNRK